MNELTFLIHKMIENFVLQEELLNNADVKIVSG